MKLSELDLTDEFVHEMMNNKLRGWFKAEIKELEKELDKNLNSPIESELKEKSKQARRFRLKGIIAWIREHGLEEEI